VTQWKIRTCSAGEENLNMIRRHVSGKGVVKANLDDYEDDFEKDESNSENTKLDHVSIKSEEKDADQIAKLSIKVTPVINNAPKISLSTLRNEFYPPSSTTSSLPSPNPAKGRRRNRGLVPWIQTHDWTLGECIGKGSFGSVYQCMNGKVTNEVHML
jgi:hypothetical protein